MDNKSTIKLLVYRSAEQEQEDVNRNGEYKEYEIPYEDRITILRALKYIKENLDSSLAYYNSLKSLNSRLAFFFNSYTYENSIPYAR